MATVIEVMAKLTGNASSMIAAFNQAKGAAESTARSAKVSGEQANEALGKIAVPATVVAGGVALAARQFALLASEAEQNVGAVESVFKDYAQTVKDTSAQAADNVGISSSAYQQFASIVGSQLKNMGVPLADVAGGTEDLIKKGADLASMFGGTTSEAIEAISSMLRGETDPIEKYGVSINAAAVEAKMLAMGLDGLEGPAKKNAELQAKLAILNQQTADATGNFGREADTAAGAMQRANAKFEDAQSAIGTALLPLMTQLAQALAEASKWAAANSDAVLLMGAILGGAALAVLAVVGAIKIYELAMALGTVATYLFQNALKGIGIGLLIVAVMAIAAVIKNLWETNEGFRNFWLGAWEQIKTVGGQALDAVKGAVDGFLPALQSMWEWMQKNTDVIVAIAGVIGTVMLPVLIRAGVAAVISAAAQVAAWAASGAGAVKAGILYVIASYQIIGGWIAQGAAAVASGAITVAIWALYAAEAIKGAAISVANAARVVGAWVLMGVQSMIHAARMAAAWFIALGPVGWVIAAVIGLVAIVIANWDAIATWTSQAWNNIVGFVVAAWEAIVSWVVGAVSNVVTPIVDGFNALSSFISSIFTAIGAFVTGVWTWMFNLVTSIGAAFWAEHGAQLTAAWDFVVAIFTAILNFYISVWTAIFTFVVETVTNIVNGIVAGFTAAYNAIVAALQAAWDFIVAVWTQVDAFIDGVMAAIGAAISAAWEFILGVITAAVNAVSAVVSSVFTSVWGFIVSVFTAVFGFLSGIWNSIYGTVSGYAQSLFSAVSSAFQSIWSTAVGVFNAVLGFLGGVWAGIVGGVAGMVGQVGSWFSSVWGTVTGIFAGAGQWLWNAGVNIVTGLINGVKSLAGTIGNAFLSMIPGWIVGPFKAALNIASPSKLFHQFGRWIIQGLGLGIDAEEGTAVAATTRAARAVERAGSGITIAAPRFETPKVPQIDTSSLTVDPITVSVLLDASAFERSAKGLRLGGVDGGVRLDTGAPVSPMARGYGGDAPQAPIVQNFDIRNYNPVAEPTSKTVEKAQDYAALAGSF